MSEKYQFQVPNINGFKANYYFCENQEVKNAHDYPPHVHDDVEIYILIEGDVSFMVENNVYGLSSGDAIISRPNQLHNCILNSDSVHKHMCFWLDASCEFLFGKLLAKGKEKSNLISPTKEDKELLFDVCKKLNNASEEGQTLRQFYLILQMTDILNRNYKDYSVRQNVPEILVDILADINKHFVEINSLKFLTDKYNVSQSTLNRLFKKHLNTTPKLYLETKRLAYSRILLCEGKTVFEACMLSGFPDYSNYIRLFKKHTDITPKQYQEKQKR